MAKILCLETATSVCSVALFNDDKLISHREINEGFRHSEKLTVFIEEILKEAKIRIDEISAVAVSNGPGSYTGLRIGMSVAKGLCFARDIPMIAIPTPELMVARAIEEIKFDNDALFCPMIDARRMEVYCALYDSSLNVVKDITAEVVDENFYSDVEKKIFFFGDGAEKCRSVLKQNFIYTENILPSARYMGSLAMKKFSKSLFENASLAEPYYLKEFIAGKKNKIYTEARRHRESRKKQHKKTRIYWLYVNSVHLIFVKKIMTQKYINDLSYKIIGCAMEVHKQLGPGLLESVYEVCFIEELRNAGLSVKSQVCIPIIYKGKDMGVSMRIDLLINDLIIVEEKAVEVIIPVYKAQLLSYLKLSNLPKGLLINFNTETIKEQLVSMVTTEYSKLPEY